MVLVAILVDIHTFTHVIHSLQMATQQCLFVPLSAGGEVRLVQRKLSKALGLWAAAYMEQSCRDWVVMYLFCQMSLSLSSLQMLPVLAGYPPRLACDGPVTRQQELAADDELKRSPGAHRFAWQIMEHAETLSDTIPSPWLPVAVFYAGLVIWRCSVLKLDSSTTGHGSRKVLLLFIEELRRMPWPCCTTMVLTLEALMN
ncbi:hypothetical protein CH63R_09645 [Colletotrichum higginsianum IMI 349063]|uniref:Uncharacterized protein n=3 Tax=Colletotrichum higginsianum TaxID=80884 RepID=A0A1B7Y7Z8_COLHI|nr:hypothetical protein CH63R_09645 [Colletotrichum higginsianum IMI 349063]OBR08124.1 hypothetical protein CH63R_09645 [Colletotrichum higginsianum IMI 349063]TIC91645.1 hypothetical protein CH35J_010974 [Colletotrichum higginsianum]